MQHVRNLRNLLPALLAFPTSVALSQGGPPLITDDPGTPGDGVWEINLAFTVEKTAEKEWFFEAPLLDINYGVGDSVQLKFEVPWVFDHQEGGSTKDGLGNSELGVKWRFLDQEEYLVDVSLYPQLSFNSPTSSADRGLVEEGTELFLPFEVERRFGPFSLNPEIGFLVREEGQDEWAYGVAVGYELFEGLELIGEIHGEADGGLDEHELVFNVGSRWEVTENLRLLVSLGRGVRGGPSGEPEFLGYFGLQFLF